jgi:hypothetical protein
MAEPRFIEYKPSGMTMLTDGALVLIDENYRNRINKVIELAMQKALQSIKK